MSRAKEESHRACCPVCNKDVRLRKCGRFFVHGPLEDRCQMSDHVPPQDVSASLSQTKTQLNESPLSCQPTDDPHTLLSDIRFVKGRILRFVPRGSRVQWASTLTECIDRILQDPADPAYWRRLLLAPSLCLKQPERGGHNRRPSLASVVNKQCSTFLSSSDLLSVATPSDTSHTRVRKFRNNDSRLPGIVSRKLDEGDIKGAVRLVSSSDTIAPFDEATLLKLREKHPPRPKDHRLFPTSNAPPLQIEMSEVRSAMDSFKAGSSGGLSGLRPQHLKDALCAKTCEASGRFLTSLTGLVNSILAGNVPSCIQPVLFGAAVTAFNKKEGGVRPIAVGETIRRLSSKCASRAVRTHFSTMFSPAQVGFGVSGGSEAAVHASRSFIKDANPGDVILKLDFSNAFNSMRRDHVADCFFEEAPEILPFYTLSYENDSILTFGDETLPSSEGFQQGDPLAVLGFCLGLNKQLCRLKSRFRIGYVDDVTLGDHWSTVLSDLCTFQAACEKLGLHINPSKCELTICNSGLSLHDEAFHFSSTVS